MTVDYDDAWAVSSKEGALTAIKAPANRIITLQVLSLGLLR